MTTLSIATKGEIAEIAEVMGSVGLRKDSERLRDFFWGVPKSESDLPIRGGVAVKEENGRIVGFCGLMPCRIFYHGYVYDGYQMGVLGLKPGYGPDMFALIDFVKGATRNSFLIANTANDKSSKLWTVYGGFHLGPASAAYIHYAVLPLSLIPFPRIKSNAETSDDFTDPRFVLFWAEFLNGSSGPFVSREPSRLSRLFDARLRSGCLALVTVCEQDRILGYAVLRKRPLRKTPYCRFEIIDMAAIGHSKGVFEKLFQKIFRHAHRHGGVLVEYVGAIQGLWDVVDKYLPQKRPALSNTVLWYTDIPQLEKAFGDNEGWMFGPYDGDRCI